METPGTVAAVLRRAAARIVPELEEVVHEVLHYALEDARDTIGTGRPEWPALAPETYDRGTVGPLLRTGELRDSLFVHQEGTSGTLSSSSEYIIYSELGTSHEPPRPLLAPSVRDALKAVGVTRLRFVITRAFSGA